LTDHDGVGRFQLRDQRIRELLRSCLSLVRRRGAAQCGRRVGVEMRNRIGAKITDSHYQAWVAGAQLYQRILHKLVCDGRAAECAAIENENL